MLNDKVRLSYQNHKLNYSELSNYILNSKNRGYHENEHMVGKMSFGAKRSFFINGSCEEPHLHSMAVCHTSVF